MKLSGSLYLPMYVCLCHAVTDTAIVEAVHDGARSVDDIAHTLGAGTGCGTCQPYTAALIEQTLDPAQTADFQQTLTRAAQISYAA
ncbi:MAG: (2Fe-2S)-binding protein [Pseudomonadota bacterium]